MYWSATTLKRPKLASLSNLRPRVRIQEKRYTWFHLLFAVASSCGKSVKATIFWLRRGIHDLVRAPGPSFRLKGLEPGLSRPSSATVFLLFRRSKGRFFSFFLRSVYANVATKGLLQRRLKSHSFFSSPRTRRCYCGNCALQNPVLILRP